MGPAFCLEYQMDAYFSFGERYGLVHFGPDLMLRVNLELSRQNRQNLKHLEVFSNPSVLD